ncbi:MAG TPA: hypothetical protein V6D22_24580 [Candidatus Obscuribacterales bacterium]
MFRQAAPWLKDAPRYSPEEHASAQHDCRRVQRAGRDTRLCRSGVYANYQFIVTNTADAAEDEPTRRLCKKDFKRLRRYQNCRMRMASAFKVVVISMAMVWWLVPIYLMSHAAAVFAVAYKCSNLIQGVLANSAVKTWLGTVHTA